MSQSIRNNGELRVCCHANQGADRGIVRHPDGRPYNAGLDDLNQARNSELMKEVRASIVRGEWHPTCQRCQSEEAAGIRSRRIYENELWGTQIESGDCLGKTEKDGAINSSYFPVKHMDIRFGNLCNLKCRSCGPTDSSKWYGDYYKLWGEKFSESSRTMVLSESAGKMSVSPNPYGWHESEKFWEQLSEKIEGIEQLYLVGGEPLLIQAHYRFLERCVEQGHAPRIKIEYNSNISVIPPKAIELWQHFKMVQVGASIDGIGPVNDYIRHPSKWNEIEGHLDLLDKAPGNLRVLISATVMIYNVLNFPDMMIWKARKDFKRVNTDREKPLLTPHPLHKPHHLCIQALPAQAKDYVTDLYEKKKREIADAIEASEAVSDKKKACQSAVNLLNHYEKFMRLKDLSHEMPRFWDYTYKLDQLRGESLKDSIPDLYELLAPSRHLNSSARL
jgi:sulfatase maturation enzyme AslB (radical SAM superfamily)